MLIVGTAGHIDHGKTTLIRSLTGIETDRLRQEQERGISIELGFAYIDLPDGARMGLVDVPGHEKFVHHMIAGATGVDVVVLLVAADEGVMPQTREHLAICQLLGIQRGVVVLSKVDLVDEEWLELVREEVKDSLSSTFLAQSEILDFSATWTGQALQSFRTSLFQEIQSLASDASLDGLERPFMMPVDRVFTIKGFGTVATGTTVSGVLKAGESVEVVNSRKTSKVRRIEIHAAEAPETRAGHRTALNLPELKKNDLARGNVLARPGTMRSVDRIAGVFETLETLEVPLKKQFKTLFHIGATLAEGTVRLLDADQAGPGERHLVNIRLEEPVVAMPGHRFILRGFSALADYGRTLGGGTLLWPRWVRNRPHLLKHLDVLSSSNPKDSIESAVYLAGSNGIPGEELPAWVVPAGSVPALLSDSNALPSIARLEDNGLRLVHMEHLEHLSSRVCAFIQSYHQRFPRKPGIPREELRSKLPEHLSRELVDAVFSHLVGSNTVVGDERVLALPDFQPALDDRFVRWTQSVSDTLLSAGLEPPQLKQLGTTHGIPEGTIGEVMGYLLQENIVVRLNAELYLHQTNHQQAVARLKSLFETRERVSTQELKELYGLSRKFLLPLIESFDALKITLRVGASERKLRS